MSFLFRGYKFNGYIDEWNTENVTNMQAMFYSSKFNGDISDWDTSKVTNMWNMFKGSKLEEDNKLPSWNIPN